MTEWGLDIFWNKSSINELSEDDLDFTEDFDPVGKSSEFQRVVFIFTNKEQAESYLNKIGVKFEKRNMAWQVNMNTQFI